MEVKVSLLMALVDFIPVIVFMAGMGFLMRLAHYRISPVMFAMLAGGSFLGFLAGLAKCTWKLLYSLGTDFVPLNTAFVLYQTAGFFFIMIPLCALCRAVLKGRALRNQVVAASAVPAFALLVAGAIRVVEKPSFLFFIFMGIFTSVYLIAMAIICFNKKKPLWGLMYLLSMILMYAMVGLSSQFDAGGSFEKLNWVAQCVNVLVQFFMAFPSYLLVKRFGTVKTTYDAEKL